MSTIRAALLTGAAILSVGGVVELVELALKPVRLPAVVMPRADRHPRGLRIHTAKTLGPNNEQHLDHTRGW